MTMKTNKPVWKVIQDPKFGKGFWLVINEKTGETPVGFIQKLSVATLYADRLNEKEYKNENR